MRTITDFMNGEESMSFDEIIELIKLNCNLQTDLVVCRVESYTWKKEIRYEVVEMNNLYDWLDNLIQSEDCKNGCELREENNERYFSILGSNRYERATGKFIATDEVKIYFRNYKWE